MLIRKDLEPESLGQIESRTMLRCCSRAFGVALLAACVALSQEPALELAPIGEYGSDGPVSGRDYVGVAVFHGRLLPYGVVEGMAVHAGDMVLGRVEDLRQVVPPQGHSKSSTTPVLPIPRAVSFDSDRLWTDGVIPYVIDRELPDEERSLIRQVIDEWNAKTVISLKARIVEANYVRFKSTGGGFCRAEVGMRGGEQGIFVPPGGCSVGNYVHEIGHAVGLWHEHEREDRDQYVMVLDENLDPAREDWYFAEHPADGPYDYASTMHYHVDAGSNGPGPVMKTIPPGITVRPALLSVGDIDGVAQMYGKPPADTVISTNPQGLELVVDGTRGTTPMRLNWPDGSLHTIEAPIAQEMEGSRFLFGRWNVEGDRTLSVVAGSDSTWIEANFIVQHRLAHRATPEGAGTVDLAPPSVDGYYTTGTLLEAEATPSLDSGYQFWGWSQLHGGYYGQASNPARWRVTQPNADFVAYFTKRPVVRISSQVDPFVVYIDGEERYGPFTIDAGGEDRVVQIGVDETRLIPRSSGHRYRFKSWSDGGSISHAVSFPRDPGTITVNLAEQIRLTTRIPNEESGIIEVDPPSIDGYYSKGSTVSLTATPMTGWDFVRWAGSHNSFSPSISVAIDRPMHFNAELSQTRKLVPGRVDSVILPASNSRFKVFDGESGFRIHVPENAVEVQVEFEASTPRAEVDLFVHTASDSLRWGYGPDGHTPEFEAEFRADEPGSRELVTISRNSTPPLEPGQVYYISLVRFGSRTRVTGSLVAHVRTNSAGVPSAYASPRAFSFVAPRNSDPASQSMRIENRGIGLLRYSLASDRSWLTATPVEGVIAPRKVQEVFVATTSPGLPSETHWGTLVVTARTGDDAIPDQEVVVPVTLVVLESHGGQGGPDRGDKSQGVTSPRLLYKIEPEYSEEARKAGLEGTVVLAIEVWEDGMAHNIRVVKSLGLGLDEEAIDAVRKWRFQPGMKDGKPVRVAAQVHVSFRLLKRP